VSPAGRVVSGGITPEKGYEVHGMIRRAATLKERIDHLFKDSHNKKRPFFLHYWGHVGQQQPEPLLEKIQTAGNI